MTQEKKKKSYKWEKDKYMPTAEKSHDLQGSEGKTKAVERPLKNGIALGWQKKSDKISAFS